MSLYLLLSQDQHSVWFDGVVRSQIFPAASLHSVLESFPHAVTGGPRDAEVMPLAVVDEERQLRNLQQSRPVRSVFLSS